MQFNKIFLFVCFSVFPQHNWHTIGPLITNLVPEDSKLMLQICIDCPVLVYYTLSRSPLLCILHFTTILLRSLVLDPFGGKLAKQNL